MTCTPNRDPAASAVGRAGPLCQNPLGDRRRIDCACRPIRSRWHDFDDDPDDPPMDDDEDYDDFRWEEVPDNGQAFPPDEPWDDDAWD